ncbi:MAG: ribose transport system permease protein [Thermoleophilaceae bacterium]|nr:ribose transport system permease protein [Thermoleophilaceae bacterium]
MRRATANPPGARPARRRLLELSEAHALTGLTIVLILFFTFLPATQDTFPTTGNLQVTLGAQAVLLAISLAVLLPLIGGVWDFSPGATAGLASVLAASYGASSGSVLVAVLVAAGTGLTIGVINGLLVTVAKINSVIATFGMTIVIAGVVQWKSRGNSIVEGIPSSLLDFGASKLLGLPTVVWVAFVLALVIHYLLRHTPYGRELQAVGSNRLAAGLVGIRLELVTVSAFVVGGLLAGLAGALQLARSGAGNPTIGPGFTLPAFAAVFLGAIAIVPGRWNVWGMVIAILFLGALNSGLNLAGVDPYVNNLANGLALLSGVGIANLIARRRGRILTTA